MTATSMELRAAPAEAAVLASLAALGSAVRRGDWAAVESSDRSMREAVLALSRAVANGEFDEQRARETLVSAHGEHLRALEQARAMAGDLRARLSRLGVGRRAVEGYRAGEGL